MPVFEYVCREGHVTERLCTSLAKSPKTVTCSECLQADGQRRAACRVEFSKTAPPQLKAGNGGFYKPAIPDPPAD
jgi:hypothetical protein